MADAMTDFFGIRSWKSKWRWGRMPGKRPEGVSEAKSFAELTVRLLEPARSPATSVERLVVETLKREGRTSFKRLIERVAGQIYSDEVRNGARVLDIGLFGPDLFLPDIALEVKAGDGILWEILRADE